MLVETTTMLLTSTKMLAKPSNWAVVTNCIPNNFEKPARIAAANCWKHLHDAFRHTLQHGGTCAAHGMTAKSNEKSHWKKLEIWIDFRTVLACLGSSWELWASPNFMSFFQNWTNFILFPKLNLDYVFLAYWAPRRPWVASTAPFGELFGMILGLNRLHRAHLGSHLGRFCWYFWYCGLDFFQFLQSAATANGPPNMISIGKSGYSMFLNHRI